MGRKGPPRRPFGNLDFLQESYTKMWKSKGPICGEKDHRRAEISMGSPKSVIRSLKNLEPV